MKRPGIIGVFAISTAAITDKPLNLLRGIDAHDRRVRRNENVVASARFACIQCRALDTAWNGGACGQGSRQCRRFDAVSGKTAPLFAQIINLKEVLLLTLCDSGLTGREGGEDKRH